MYWPCGVPRIYAYNGQENLGITDEEGADEGESVALDHDTAEQDGPAVDKPLPADPTMLGEADRRNIVDLCVERSDHLFATITKSSLTIWQSRVRVILYMSC